MKMAKAFENADFTFLCQGMKNILKMELFGNDDILKNHVIFLSSNTNPKWPESVFSNFCVVVWSENI